MRVNLIGQTTTKKLDEKAYPIKQQVQMPRGRHQHDLCHPVISRLAEKRDKQGNRRGVFYHYGFQ